MTVSTQCADRRRRAACEHLGQAGEVHRLGAAVVEGLAHDRVLGDLDRARDVLLAGGEHGEDRRHEVVGLHALHRGRDAPARRGSGAPRGNVTGSSASGRRTSVSEDRLDEGVADRLG